MNKLLINEPPLQVLPGLAAKIGLNEAILLQQVHYWISNPKVGVEKDGKRWVRNTTDEWQHDNFPFWSCSTIRRTIVALEKSKLLLSRDDLNKLRYDNSKWYTIDYDALAKATGQNEQAVESDCSKWIVATGQNEQSDLLKMSSPIPETLTETTTESSSLFAQVDSSQSTTSASSGKKEPKQEQPASGVLCQPDVPGSSHKEMFAALADLCKVDPNLVNGRLGAHVKSLRKAGYTVADLERFGQWWYANDFRGKRGEPPALGVVLTDLPRSVAPQPAAPQEHHYEVDTLRDWLKQWAWEAWQRVIAVQLGKLPTDAPAFREWYASEYGGLDEARLRQWWREQEQARKGE